MHSVLDVSLRQQRRYFRASIWTFLEALGGFSLNFFFFSPFFFTLFFFTATLTSCTNFPGPFHPFYPDPVALWDISPGRNPLRRKVGWTVRGRGRGRGQGRRTNPKSLSCLFSAVLASVARQPTASRSILACLHQHILLRNGVDRRFTNDVVRWKSSGGTKAFVPVPGQSPVQSRSIPSHSSAAWRSNSFRLP